MFTNIITDTYSTYMLSRLPSSSYHGSHGRSLTPVQCEGADSTGHSDEAGFDAHGAFLMMGLPALLVQDATLHFCRSKYGMFFFFVFSGFDPFGVSVYGVYQYIIAFRYGNSNWSFGYLNFKHK